MIKVLIVEDMRMLRAALVTLLRQEPDIEVISEVASGKEAITQARRQTPDVAIVDINLPDIDGFAVSEALLTVAPNCHTLMLTSIGRPGDVQRTLDAGAFGLLEKDADPTRLAEAIRKVDSGQQVIDVQLALSALKTPHPPLSPRELEALRLASEGEGPAQIAARLFLSTGTVRNYLANAVTKLGARNRLDAIRIARSSGWL
ncbi:response regulator transcription factor [Streptomyces sp. NBC_00385]|uniref:response regulator transcription factor n=1 Tax=Streptomyces sp. NBC_00385 TaxID=2975733 RepID=UPI002DD98029|nr:response regulator transcription factor [Streptomyces sp. NBC_00385]WRZ04079.1 response regulator transcription factor [Streptomyces sp. NBC_00385]